jgi:transaldolase
MNPLRQLEQYGQSFWLDYIQRSLLESGELKALIEEDGLTGITSNPSIFEKSIAGSDEYAETITRLAHQYSDANSVYEHLAIRDIQDAADILRPVYDKTKGVDGYVSLEVSPHLAHDTAGTVEEGLRLFREVNRPNVMIKVPATDEGIPAIRALIAEGLNVNVTLLFATSYYEKATLSYFCGLEDRVAKGKPIDHIASVASFFISRIDTLIDSLLASKPGATALLGKAAIANAKLTYAHFRKLYDTPRWRTLQERGAHHQRLLWASTSTKNPAYNDVMYVDELIGPHTVNTLPPATLKAFRDHGKAHRTIDVGLKEANDVMQGLSHEGIVFEQVCQQLTREGVKLFADAFDKLLKAVEDKRRKLG